MPTCNSLRVSIRAPLRARQRGTVCAHTHTYTHTHNRRRRCPPTQRLTQRLYFKGIDTRPTIRYPCFQRTGNLMRGTVCHEKLSKGKQSRTRQEIRFSPTLFSHSGRACPLQERPSVQVAGNGPVDPVVVAVVQQPNVLISAHRQTTVGGRSGTRVRMVVVVSWSQKYYGS